MNQLWWYSARAAGFVSWGLLSASLLWGLVLASKVRPLPVKKNWTLDLHRYLGGLAVVFVGIHVASIVADSYVHFSLIDVLVPFASTWHPAAVAWGIVAMWLLLAVEITSLARKYLSKTLWHTIHLLSLPLFAFSTIHLLTAGTDRNAPVVRLAVAGVLTAIVFLGLARLRKPEATPQQRRPVRPAIRTGATSPRTASPASTAAPAWPRPEPGAYRAQGCQPATK
jgi:hypothetical protein